MGTHCPAAVAGGRSGAAQVHRREGPAGLLLLEELGGRGKRLLGSVGAERLLEHRVQIPVLGSASLVSRHGPSPGCVRRATRGGPMTSTSAVRRHGTASGPRATG